MLQFLVHIQLYRGKICSFQSTYIGDLSISESLISGHFNIIGPIEAAGAHKMSNLSRGLSISGSLIPGSDCISFHKSSFHKSSFHKKFISQKLYKLKVT